MDQKHLQGLSDGDFIKLNKKGHEKFNGRFNYTDHYRVKSARAGMFIFDDSGICRFLNEYLEYFDII